VGDHGASSKKIPGHRYAFRDHAKHRFGGLTDDEVFITAKAAQEGVVIENLGKTWPLVLLRYFGPDVNPNAPEVGDYRQSAAV